MGDGVTNGTTNGSLPSDQVDDLARDLRAGDVWRAQDDWPDDTRRTGMAALRYAAIRRGILDPSVDLVSFLDSIPIADLEHALATRSVPPAPVSNAPGSSRGSADTGG